jgi:malate dehydrogenase
MKVSIIGAGAVGSTLAMRVAESGLADVVLVDIFDGLARGKALDILDASPIMGHEKTITGGSDYKDIDSSDIVVMTAGFPRKPGMSREHLTAKNADIVRSVAEVIRARAPKAIIIVVTNPLDSMAYLAYKVTAIAKHRIIGMAGILDSARFIQLIAAELDVPRSSVETFILGSHGDTMIPVISHTRVAGKPLTQLMPQKRIEDIVKQTRDRGAEIVSLLGTGSAYFSPSAATFRMIRAMAKDTKEVLTASCYLTGEYGLKDIFIGVPCRVGSQGIEEIIELDLAEGERGDLLKSADAIRNSLALLNISRK